MDSEQHKQYWEALQRLINAAWHKPDAAMAFTIPADEEHDADLILSRALNRLEELEQQLAQARALLEGIERILATNSDYNAVTEWRDQYTAWLARKE